MTLVADRRQTNQNTQTDSSQHLTCDGINIEFDFWALRPTQGSLLTNRCETHRPVASISDCGPVEFHIANVDNDSHLDLTNMFLYVKAKTEKGDGTDLVEKDRVAPPNMCPQVDVSLKDQLVSAFTPLRSKADCLTETERKTRNIQHSTSTTVTTKGVLTA